MPSTALLSQYETEEIASKYRLCACGCGKPAVVGAEIWARRLQACQQTVKGLNRLSLAGGKIGKEADHLLWSWERAYPAIDALVHNKRMEDLRLGLPTPLWVSGWRDRARKLQITAAQTGKQRFRWRGIL